MSMNSFRFKAPEHLHERVVAFLDAEWLAGRVTRWESRKATDYYGRTYWAFGESVDLLRTEFELTALAWRLTKEGLLGPEEKRDE
jgi:hypothetical protein